MIVGKEMGCEYAAGASGFACGYQVIVKNEGPDAFAGVLTVHDEPAAGGAAPLFAGPWACVPAGAGFDCSLDFAAIVKKLAGYGYEGWFVVEAEQDPKVSPPLEMAQKGHKELLRVMAAAGYEVA